MENAKALVAQAQVLADHAHAAHEAGTAANLDELRAQVQLQAQQQALIAAQNQQAKDLILLKREIGVDPGQVIELTDPAPYSELAEQTPEEVRALAYKNRQDYQNLQNQAVEYKAVHAVYRSERLPTLSFYSYYGTSTVNGAGTHGDFVAMGTLNFPIFREARLRGDEDASKAQMDAVNAQLDDLRNHIDEQVRAALLDVNASKQAGGRGAVERGPGHARAERRDRPRERRRGRQPAAGDGAGHAGHRREQPGGEPVPVQRVEARAGARRGRAGAAVPGVSGAVRPSARSPNSLLKQIRRSSDVT